jgi:inhibitor of KinA
LDDIREKLRNAKLLPVGEAAVLVSFDTKIDPVVHQAVRAFAACLEQHPFKGMTEYVEAFTGVTVFYDPAKICGEGLLQPDPEQAYSYQAVVRYLQKLLSGIEIAAQDEPRCVRIPVCYGGAYGPDLEAVAEYHGMTAQEVIHLHAGGAYLVYMIGFAPGFPYVGGLPACIATPRRKSPRLAIPKGSVGIAGSQTGVYPLETPGGWQLIGRTPLALFRPEDQENPSLLRAGDRLEFYEITQQEYEAMENEGSVPRP